jgi:hypothetical protein
VEYVVSQISLVAILLLMLGAPGIALPCNPVIDGTYCATNSRRDISTSPTRFEPIRNIGDEARPGGNDFAPNQSVADGAGYECSI